MSVTRGGSTGRWFAKNVQFNVMRMPRTSQVGMAEAVYGVRYVYHTSPVKGGATDLAFAVAQPKGKVSEKRDIGTVRWLPHVRASFIGHRAYRGIRPCRKAIDPRIHPAPAIPTWCSWLKGTGGTRVEPTPVLALVGSFRLGSLQPLLPIAVIWLVLYEPA
jgi:hypothetical protein